MPTVVDAKPEYQTKIKGPQTDIGPRRNDGSLAESPGRRHAPERPQKGGHPFEKVGRQSIMGQHGGRRVALKGLSLGSRLALEFLLVDELVEQSQSIHPTVGDGNPSGLEGLEGHVGKEMILKRRSIRLLQYFKAVEMN